MAKLTKNPFKFGDPVEGDYYFPRPELTKIVCQFLDNRIHMVLIGPRRFGKTSFIIDTIRQEEKKGKTCLLIDIFNVTSHKDFLQQMIVSISQKKAWTSKVKEWIQSIPRLRPKVSWEMNSTTGEPVTVSITPDASSEKDMKELIQETLAALTKLGGNVIVAIDEFQTVSELEDDGWLEATLRTQMQQMKNVVFLFSGSRKSIIYDMLNNPRRPFYRTCQIMEFPALPEAFNEWIIQRFRLVGISCEKNSVIELRRLVQDTPNYIQMACFHLVAQGITQVNSQRVREVLHTIVKQNSYAYQTILNSITPIQQRALRLTAHHGEEIFAKDLLRKYEIKSGAALASALKALKQKQLLDDEGTKRGRVIFDDPLFAIWLRDQFHE